MRDTCLVGMKANTISIAAVAAAPVTGRKQASGQTHCTKRSEGASIEQLAPPPNDSEFGKQFYFPRLY